MKAVRPLLVVFSFCLLLPVASFAARELPVPVRTVAPECPPNLRGTSGLVMVKVTIDPQGNVSETNVVKSSNEEFDKYAVEALKKWKFKPASEDGKAIGISVTIPVKFVGES